MSMVPGGQAFAIIPISMDIGDGNYKTAAFAVVMIGGSSALKLAKGAPAATSGVASNGMRVGQNTGHLAPIDAFRAGEAVIGTGEAVTIQQLRRELGRAGMSVRRYDIQLGAHLAPHEHGSMRFIQELVTIRDKSGNFVQLWRPVDVARESGGRPLIYVSELGLSSLDNAVATVGHEIGHIVRLNMSEQAGEQFAQRFLQEFLRNRRLVR